MRFLDFLRNRDVLTKIWRIIQRVVRLADVGTLLEAREELAKRLAEGARKGDFDDSLKKLRTSDQTVQDYIENG